MKQSVQEHIVVYFKGLAMGAADVVPGVSGGTIALITHIYERLINAIDRVSLTLVLQLFSRSRKAAWQSLDGSFLLTLALGIGTSIFLVSSGVSWLLTAYPIPLWAFFFGLILASAFVLKNSVTKWNITALVMVVMGFFIAFGIGIVAPSTGSDSLIYLFLCGMLVVIAMILPGISGAFILILLGVYETALNALDKIKAFEVEGLIVFLVMAAGGLVGLKAFARILRWLFNQHKNIVMATMTGFLLGSLYKVWPWKKVTSYYTNSDGLAEPLSTAVILPDLSNPNAQVLLAFSAFIGALFLLYFLEKFSTKSHG
jgi:putative membrane protein